MLPEEFTRRIKTQQYINSELLLKSLGEPSPVSIRVNSIKWTRKPAESVQVPWCSEGWYLNQRPSFTLDPLFHAGCYYPQEASGMFTGEVFRRIAGEKTGLKVLDLCGAPGGKSTHISSIIQGNGVLVTNEVIRPRAGILADNITRWGIANTIVTNSDPSAFSQLKGFFDVILVDAPCSGEGMFRDPVAIREWSVPNTLLCQERQKRILLSVWPALKENGVLIYSTCTFNPAENEEQVKWLINTRRAESISFDVSSYTGIREIDNGGIKGYGFHPGMINGEGFFISAIRKLENEKPSAFLKGKNKLPADLRTERLKIRPWLNREPKTLLKNSGVIYSVPLSGEDYTMLINHLSVVKCGTELGTEKNEDFIPSHELALSELISPEILPSFDVNLSQAISFLKKENISVNGIPGGWVIVRYMGINMGLIKNIGSRINNYFPAGWRIRMAPDADKLKNIITWTGCFDKCV